MPEKGGTRRAVIQFLREVDARLEIPPHEVWISGGAAVLLAYGGRLATVDVDFIGVKDGVLLELAQLAARDSAIHGATALYADVVPPGLFLSEFGWRRRAVPFPLPGSRT